jgi:septal ring factor EnvC (AmiA/AmiB activator)
MTTLISLGSLALLGPALAAAPILYLSLRRELRTTLREQRDKEAALGAEVYDIRAKLQTLDAKLQELAAAASEPAAMQQIPSAVNMSKRIQAIRMLRRGENSAHIAAALGMARQEVELLIRVHQMGAHRAARAAGAG